VASALDGAAAELVAAADTETALGTARLTGEVARATGQLRHFAAVLADGGYADAVVSPGGEGVPGLRRVNRPIGPVAVFAASNFPFAFSVAGNDTASALAAGCPVVVKAHEGHPRTSALTAGSSRGAGRAGAPAGTFAVVFGVAAGVRLLQHPAIAAAGLPGRRVGAGPRRHLRSAPGPIPFFGELGSVNPVVILPGAAAARPADIAAGYAASLTLGVGQFCTNPGLLFVPAAGRAPAARDRRGRPGERGRPDADGPDPRLVFAAPSPSLAPVPMRRRLAEGQAGRALVGHARRCSRSAWPTFAAGLPASRRSGSGRPDW
jgi:NADP-dependent aldehyde dehydrogenase